MPVFYSHPFFHVYYGVEELFPSCTRSFRFY